jgi:hypothetical protein
MWTSPDRNSRWKLERFYKREINVSSLSSFVAIWAAGSLRHWPELNRSNDFSGAHRGFTQFLRNMTLVLMKSIYREPQVYLDYL